MEHFNFKDAFKVFASLYRYRKTINPAKIGKTLKWFFTHPVIVKCIPYIAVFQRYVTIPAMVFAFTAAGWCISTLFLLKTNNILGSMGIMIMFVVITILEVYCIFKATPKFKIKFIITEDYE